jgi:moderate conductance mechanosensitive channel
LGHLQGLEGAAASALRIGLIATAAWLATLAAQRAIKGLRMRIASRLGDIKSAQRAATLGRVFRYLAAVVISLLAGTLALSELGVNAAPIPGAAGVAGPGVGFGAQSLLKDYFTGFFLLVRFHPGHAARPGTGSRAGRSVHRG